MRRSLCMTVLLIALPALLIAQAQTTSKISGVVTDADGNPIAGANISFSSPALQGEREMVSKEDGTFLAALLPPGQYTVTTTSPGKEPVQYIIELRVGVTFPLSILLGEGQDFNEQIVVYGERTDLPGDAVMAAIT